MREEKTMNRNKYPVNNYVPYNPDKYLASGGFEHTLGYTLDKHKYQKIINDPEYHFENSYVTNFDLIHHQCRGDKLEGNKKDYETISKKKVNKEIKKSNIKDNFILNAINSERKDVFLKKDLLTEHFNRINLDKRLEQKHVFLSSMKKRAFFKQKKYTDDCKSLPF